MSSTSVVEEKTKEPQEDEDTISTTASAIAPPAAKQAKLSMNAYPQAPPEQWPPAWLLPETLKDPCLDNHRDPDVPVTVAELRDDIGICYWKMDPTSYEYPIKAVPWDPKDAMDPKLKALRDDRGYSYADILTIHPDHLPDFEQKIAMFFEEHIHDAEEIRYVLSGRGFFDVRNLKDEWVRIHVKQGDLITLPEGIYHRFTCDTNRIIHVMRLFIGQPVWTPFNRPQEEHPSRKAYVTTFLEKNKSDNNNNNKEGDEEAKAQEEK
ncbi:hypothetical protein ACA910_012552 [Epithemia clementina (nom. ined.)]